MGLDPFSFADALLGVLAQRLARSLCKQCRQRYVADATELDGIANLYGRAAFEELLRREGPGEIKLWKPVGCENCGQSGYRGRIALHELLVTDDEMKHAIQHKSAVGGIRTLAQTGGMTTLLQDGIAKILAGHTDLTQVMAVCSR